MGPGGTGNKSISVDWERQGVVTGKRWTLAQNQHPEGEPTMRAATHYTTECGKDALRGRAKLNLLPRPSSLVAHIRPSCASTMIFEI